MENEYEKLPFKLHKYIVAHLPFIEERASLCAFVLEIGVGDFNGSSLALTKGLERSERTDKLYISIDNADRRIVPFEMTDEDIGKPRSEFIPGATLPYWHFIVGDSTSTQTISKMREIAGSRSPDLILVDSNHVYAHLKRELEIWRHVADKHTVWLFHDTYSYPDGGYNPMTEAAKEFAKDVGRQWVDYSTECNGIGMIPW